MDAILLVFMIGFAGGAATIGLWWYLWWEREKNVPYWHWDEIEEDDPCW